MKRRPLKQVPLTVLGLGGVGRALARQILEQRVLHERRFRLAFRFYDLCDSQSVVRARELDDRELEQILHLKQSGKKLSDHSAGQPIDSLAALFRRAIQARSILVDCTASAEIGPLLAEAAQRGIRLVLANKKPLTQSREQFEKIAGAARPSRFSRWESTVGAGLPIIAALNRLVACGDRVESVSGSLSSTLGYLMTGLQEGRRFSRLVEEVREAGYTEADPREDLGGSDAARKGVILARTLGWRAGMESVAVQPLLSAEMKLLPLAEFLRRLPELDSGFEARAQAAAKRGAVLRYAVTATPDDVRVGLLETPLNSPMGRLTGTNQIVEVRSRWYSPSPLVIQGRGAGVDATAAGVLSDIVELAAIENSDAAL